jgi:hypothetical protein
MDGWQLCWSSGTKTTSVRSACLKYLGLAIPWYIYGSTNLVGRPECVTFQGRCALVRPASLLWTPRILRGNEGLPVGCAPDGPAKYFWVLGRSCFETFLRSACLEWLCHTLAAMQDIWVSLHSIYSRSTISSHNFSYDVIDNLLHTTHLSRFCWVSSDTGH